MNRTELESTVIACVVDWTVLVRHVRGVPRLTSEVFGAPLTVEQLARVLASGPSALSDAELLELSLNANQLIQLHEAVYGDDTHPDAPVAELVPSAFWMNEIEKAAKGNRK